MHDLPAIKTNYRLTVAVQSPGSDLPDLEEVSSTSKEMLIQRLRNLANMYESEKPIFTTCGHCKARLQLIGVPWITIHERNRHFLDCDRCGKPNELHAVVKCKRTEGPGQNMEDECTT